MTNFDDFKLAVEALSGGKNTVLLDDIGMPSVVVPLLRLNYADVIIGGTQEPLPAFLMGNVPIDVIYQSKYINIIVNDRAYSLPMKDPAVSLNFDRAIQVCRNKGPGWHLQTNALWAAIALWCRRNGTMPRGNNNRGADIDAPHERGVETHVTGGQTGRTATGSGPVTWNHNWHDSGIADLNGNVREWCGGLRLMDGEIQIIPYGNAMRHDSNMSATSAEWRAIMPDGSLVNPGTAGTVRYTQTSIGFHAVTVNPAPTAANPNLLHGLALVPEGGLSAADYGGAHLWATLTGERLPARGGHWSAAASAGVFYLRLSSTRATADTTRGFRSAFVG